MDYYGHSATVISLGADHILLENDVMDNVQEKRPAPSTSGRQCYLIKWSAVEMMPVSHILLFLLSPCIRPLQLLQTGAPDKFN